MGWNITICKTCTEEIRKLNVACIICTIPDSPHNEISGLLADSKSNNSTAEEE